MQAMLRNSYQWLFAAVCSLAPDEWLVVPGLTERVAGKTISAPCHLE